MRRRGTHMLLARTPEEKRTLRRTRRRWMDNIKMDLGKLKWGVIDWIDMTPDNEKRRRL
jgi:hypothetical protein